MINILMNQKPGLTDWVSCPTMEITLRPGFYGRKVGTGPTSMRFMVSVGASKSKERIESQVNKDNQEVTKRSLKSKTDLQFTIEIVLRHGPDD